MTTNDTDAVEQSQAAPTAPKLTVPGLADHQLSTIAQMEALGRSAEQIAALLGISVRKVKTMVGAEQAPLAYTRHRDAYRQKILNSAVNHYFWTIDQLNKVEQALELALTGSDQRLSYDAAKYLRESIIPQPTREHRVAIDHRVDAQITNKLEGAAASIGAVLAGIRDSIPAIDATFRTVQAPSKLNGSGTVEATNASEAPSAEERVKAVE